MSSRVVKSETYQTCILNIATYIEYTLLWYFIFRLQILWQIQTYIGTSNLHKIIGRAQTPCPCCSWHQKLNISKPSSNNISCIFVVTLFCVISCHSDCDLVALVPSSVIWHIYVACNLSHIFCYWFDSAACKLISMHTYMHTNILHINIHIRIYTCMIFAYIPANTYIHIQVQYMLKPADTLIVLSGWCNATPCLGSSWFVFNGPNEISPIHAYDY